jgi:cell division transport system ATP-binding protein
MEGDTTILEVSGVSKIYDRRWRALQDVNLQIQRGEFVLLVGPCGAGKTTLMRLITREAWPTSGTIRVAGDDVTGMGCRDIPVLRRKLGLVFQDGKLLSDKTVFENIAFALRVTGAGRKEISAKTLTALSLVGLAHKTKFLPEQLSGGEKQQVAIARAIVNKPILLLADEPTGNLDPEATTEILDLFGKINRFGTTILLATHDPHLIKTPSHRRIEIANGQIV